MPPTPYCRKLITFHVISLSSHLLTLLSLPTPISPPYSLVIVPSPLFVVVFDLTVHSLKCTSLQANEQTRPFVLFVCPIIISTLAHTSSSTAPISTMNEIYSLINSLDLPSIPLSLSFWE